MPTLATKEYCTGCTACASICLAKCITMESDENGFMHPVVEDKKCVSCNLCEKSCPIVTPFKAKENNTKAYAVYSKDEKMRLDSSSGGVFTEIARTVLAEGGVVYGAAYNERFEVVHVCVDNEADLAKLRGAKYAQSDLRGIFRDVKVKLKAGQKVLFSGTPCQVGGLKAFLQKNYQNLLTMDFVCLSVPSPMAWRQFVKYRAQIDNNGELPVRINLRSKKSGWSNFSYSNLFEYSDGSVYCVRNVDSLWMKLFGGGYISRKACAHCKFKGYSRVSDLTVGDFWGIWDIAPEMDDSKGTSVVLVQSEIGAEIFSRIGHNLVIKEVSLEEASRQNQAMLKTVNLNERRYEALNLIRYGRIEKCLDLLPIPEPATCKVPRTLKNLIGKVLRKIGFIP